MSLSSVLVENQCIRTIWNLVVSCLTTVLLGAWLALHPNIAAVRDLNGKSDSNSSSSPDLSGPNIGNSQNGLNGPQDSNTSDRAADQQAKEDVKLDTNHKGRSYISKPLYLMRIFFLERLPPFLVFLIVPEYILGWAIRQYYVAKEIAKKHNCSTSHGFFIIMGGFHVFDESHSRTGPEADSGGPETSTTSATLGTTSLNLSESAIRLYPLTRHAVAKLLSDEKIELPSESEVKDRGKSSSIIKTLALIQTMWFLIQCLSRATTSTNSEPLPITKIELLTITYILVLLCVYLVWWEKPWNIKRPIPVKKALMVGVSNGNNDSNTTNNNNNRDKKDTPLVKAVKSLVGAQDDFTDMSKQHKVPLFYSGNPPDQPLAIAGIASQLFGMVIAGILCTEWSSNSNSPTFPELVLWRITSLSILGFLVIMAAVVFNIVWEMILGHTDPGPLESKYDLLLSRTMLMVTAVLYVCARVASLVLAFISLRSLPEPDFMTVCWTTRIPHI